MYNVGQLFRLTWAGFSDLWPAVRQAFNADKTDDRLNLVYGSNPRRRILILTFICTLAGEWFARFGPQFPVKDYVNWSAVVVGVAFALTIRRYLFTQGKASGEDFPWLAASLVPAIALCALITVLTYASGISTGNDTFFLRSPVQLGGVLVAITNGLGVAAALTIAVATLCFSRDWFKAGVDLVSRLFVFRVMVWVTAFVMFEIQIVGEILLPIVGRFVGLEIPEWLADLADQLSYAGFLILAYLAIIGTTWTVCKASFSTLLEQGQVDILKAIQASVDNSKKARKSKSK